MKLNRAIGIFSKLRYNANLSVLKIIYHSLLYLAPIYFMGPNYEGKRPYRQRLLFRHYKTKPFRKLPLKNAKMLLQFRDHITQQNCLFVLSLEQNSQLLSSFKIFHCGHTHNYSTWSANKNILDIPYSQTYTYGTKSVMYSCIKDSNNFKRSFPKLFQGRLTYPRIKLVSTDHLLNQY